MNIQQYLSYSSNMALLSRGFDQNELAANVSDVLSWIKQFEVVDDSDPLKGFHSVKGGMTTLTNELVSRLKILSNVSLIYGENVVEVTKKKNTFDVMTTSSEIPFEGKKLILACNKGGIDMISWQSPKRRVYSFNSSFQIFQHYKQLKYF
ncbi:hypothetical protein EB796_004065 [Bugula neritina]|uniref:Uncharacterized protein n=1 Tax=Bugula neritina TaxID=10212 RepID=A0A7J7KG36_BUGNE|nr:hypothetical protein EB796_004065 [Bugula neritina]